MADNTSDSRRPALAGARDPRPVFDFVAELQAAVEDRDADGFNRRFANDVVWGSPFGAIVDGYDALHAIHTTMFATLPEGVGSRYAVEHVRFPTDDVAIAYVRRTSTRTGEPEPGHPEAFGELALFVFVRRGGEWWLAAAQHTPDRRDLYSSSRS